MSAPHLAPVFDKVRKYEYQCDLAYAIFSLTRPYFDPSRVNRFLQKWPPSDALRKQLDKHLRHGLNLLLQLAVETGFEWNNLPEASRDYCRKFQEQIETRNFLLTNEAAHLSNLFEKNSISCVALKGVSCYALFETSYFQTRISSDLDLLIPKARLHDALRITAESGYAELPPTRVSYSSMEAVEELFYSRSIAKKTGVGWIEIDLHWTIPAGEISETPRGPQYEPLEEKSLATFWETSRVIAWHEKRLRVPSDENTLLTFLLAVRIDHAAQINLIRWLRAAKDYAELKRVLPPPVFDQALKQTPFLTRQLEELSKFSDRLFGGDASKRGTIRTVPKMLYRSLAAWVPHKNEVLKAWLALHLSRRMPVLFKIGCFLHILWHNTFCKEKPKPS